MSRSGPKGDSGTWPGARNGRQRCDLRELSISTREVADQPRVAAPWAVEELGDGGSFDLEMTQTSREAISRRSDTTPELTTSILIWFSR